MGAGLGFELERTIENTDIISIAASIKPITQIGETATARLEARSERSGEGEEHRGPTR